MRRTGSQQQPTPSLVTGGKAVSSALIQGRQSGHLKLRGRGLTALPAEACHIGSVALPEGSAWWETRETLETLDASQNEIASLPDEISALDQLRELNLTHNRLTALPDAPCWATLEALVSLCIGHNELASLPDGFGAHNAPPLVRLAGPHNRLRSVPSSLGELRDLVELDLSHNKLAALPPGLSGLASLKKLALNANSLVALPDDLLGAPPPLVDVDLSENQLQALRLPLPTAHTINLAKNRLVQLHLAGCDALQELVAPYNALPALPTGLPSLPSLATIDLGQNKLVVLDELANCRALTRVERHSRFLAVAPFGRLRRHAPTPRERAARLVFGWVLCMAMRCSGVC